MQALENSRLFYFGDMEELYWNEMGLEMDQSRLTGEPWPLLEAIENWKAVSLRDAICQRLEQSVRPSNLAAGGSETSGAEPAILSIASGVSASGDPPGFDEGSIWWMAEMAEAQLGEMQGIIFDDDPLGFLSAFLYAGAASVVATRWPTQTEDARVFAAAFYNHAFAGRSDGVVNLAHAVQAAVVELWEHWDEDEPYHWAQFQLCKPYNSP
ncbi:hypothetical protein S7711_11478 [Stachybotrys chartarum IBT 7711]|uniref:CHAT domain-containing protein n=1 Tax=Stachybotrys chartarum (strain CBS 109288 / IBT 7711) TaxID=1280523 RepID=A0A084AU48_STACB|nr:hypothetical protein S7711_11478 [Stachybotrys chartarum IBT 7711]